LRASLIPARTLSSGGTEEEPRLPSTGDQPFEARPEQGMRCRLLDRMSKTMSSGYAE
jgi:hypothetical protein